MNSCALAIFGILVGCSIENSARALITGLLPSFPLRVVINTTPLAPRTP